MTSNLSKSVRIDQNLVQNGRSNLAFGCMNEVEVETNILAATAAQMNEAERKAKTLKVKFYKFINVL